MGKDNAYPNVRSKGLKVMNNESKTLTNHEIIDRIVEQIQSMLTQVCKESKFWIHPNLRWPSYSFTYLFTFTYFCIVHMQTLKEEFSQGK